MIGRIRYKQLHWSSYNNPKVHFNPLHMMFDGEYVVIGRVINPRCSTYKTMFLEVAEIRKNTKKRTIVDLEDFGGQAEYAKFQFVQWRKIENLTDKQSVIYGL